MNIKPIIGLALIIDAIILDQLSKWLILEYVFKPENGLTPMGFFEWITSTERLPFTRLEIFPHFNLTMVWNQGISFGMLKSDNPWPLIVMTLVICAFFIHWLLRSKYWGETIALSLVIGGALGNVIDRLHFGAVADFLDFYYGDWHYPAFNLADSFISIGIVLLIFFGLLSRYDEQEKQ